MMMCVLTGIRAWRDDQNMRWWSSNPHSGISTVLEYVAYCYIFIPFLPCYSSPHLSYHTRSFAHPGVAHLPPRILTSQSASTHLPGSYCLTLSPRRLLLFYSRDIYSKVDLSCFSAVSWNHYASIMILFSS